MEREKGKMSDLKDIIKTLKCAADKNSKAYKVLTYHLELTTGTLDEGRIALVRSELLSIEKELVEWTEKHPNNGSTIMQPEESAIILINDLRERGII